MEPVDMAATTGEDEPTGFTVTRADGRWRFYVDGVEQGVVRYRLAGLLLAALSGFLVGVVAGYVVWRLM